ncbi:hypothetical protein ACIGXA_20370 [Streptomyces fildesensis]|uniref:Tetratricopeptide repeat protein n=1 Tax=Streptomyces fildesensis TaxID=375757 RepID=A0ABW8C8W2_9ACTN
MAEAGDFDGAEHVAREVEAMAGDAINPGPRARARALTSVAEVMARSGNVDRAESTVRTITDPDRLDSGAARRVADDAYLMHLDTLHGCGRP